MRCVYWRILEKTRRAAFTLAAYRRGGRFCAGCSPRRADWRASCSQPRQRIKHAALARRREHHDRLVVRVLLNDVEHSTRELGRAALTCSSGISTFDRTVGANLEEKRVPLIVVFVSDHDPLDWNGAIARIEREMLGMQPLRHVFAVRKGRRERDESDGRRNASQNTPH